LLLQSASPRPQALAKRFRCPWTGVSSEPLANPVKRSCQVTTGRRLSGEVDANAPASIVSLRLASIFYNASKAVK
jgi:hypothetical protein